MAHSAMTKTMPIVKVKTKKGTIKAAPPLVPAQKGNFHMAPKPMAELAEARMNPRRELQTVSAMLLSDAIVFPFFLNLISERLIADHPF